MSGEGVLPADRWNVLRGWQWERTVASRWEYTRPSWWQFWRLPRAIKATYLLSCVHSGRRGDVRLGFGATSGEPTIEWFGLDIRIGPIEMKRISP